MEVIKYTACEKNIRKDADTCMYCEHKVVEVKATKAVRKVNGASIPMNKIVRCKVLI